jgi:hypothetical protein
VATFGEPTYVRSSIQEGASDGVPESASARTLETASKLQKITQELRRPRPEAPRRATGSDFVAEAYREACERLEKRITAHLPAGRLTLAITNNQHTMISVKRDEGLHFRARVHHMFLEAPPVITRALARYIASNERDSSRELGAFIEAHQADIQPTRTPGLRGPQLLETRGRFFDLQEMFDGLNARYFQGQIDARVSWGGRGGARRRRRTSMKMGSYSVEEKLIRIHPSLDRDFVPRYFVEWIVFHEMLHQVHTIKVVGGRRVFHPPAFLAQERTFHDYHRARDWERRNLDRLLTY